MSEQIPFEIDSKESGIAEFWDSLEEGNLTTTKCSECGEIHWPPRTMCSGCLSTNLDYIELPNVGELYSFTEVMVSHQGLAFPAPYILGVVELDAAGKKLRIFSRLIKSQRDKLKIGMRMKFETELVGERTLYTFSPL